MKMIIIRTRINHVVVVVCLLVVESMKAVNLVFIQRVSSAGGISLEIHCWSQNPASLRDAHDYHSFCLIMISFRLIVQPYLSLHKSVVSGILEKTWLVIV